MTRNDLIEAPDFGDDIRGKFVILDDSGKHPPPMIDAFSNAGIERNVTYQVQGTKPAAGIFPAIEVESSTGKQIKANPAFFLVLNYTH